jgi:hypothetical protein
MIMNITPYHQEIREALGAARETLSSLEKVEAHLRSARNWGIWDMLGGGFISWMGKHSKLDAAQQEMEYAKSCVKKLQKELGDINDIPDLQIQTGDFLTFADFFFDGIIADWLVQSRIHETMNQVETAIANVTHVVEILHQMEQRG